MRVFVPLRKRITVKETEEFWRTRQIRGQRVFPEELAEHPERFAFHVPSSTVRELIRLNVLDREGVAVWSLWNGYLRMASGRGLKKLLADHEIELAARRSNW